MTLLQALQGKLGPTAAEPALLQGVIQKLGKVQFRSADPVAELVKAGVSSHSILRSAVRLSASLRLPIFRNYFSDYVMLQ